MLQRLKQRCQKFSRSISLRRLEDSIQTFEAELDALIQQRKQDTNIFPYGWNERSKQLLETSKRALNDRDADRGWHCLKAADRVRYYGLEPEALKNEARIILAEASDQEKQPTKWRKDSILNLLADGAGKMKSELNATEVVRAKMLLDEHQDNGYHKLTILRNRLKYLTVASSIIVAVWVAFSPIALPAPETGSAFVKSPQSIWLAVVLSGALGSVVSGFTSSISRDATKTRIPAELSASTITFARLFLGMASAVVISVFLVSGVLKFSKPSYELLLVVALASGFSDRLLLRAIESISKP